MAERHSAIEDVRGSSIYPTSGPRPPANAVVRTPAALGHPEQRSRMPGLGRQLDAALFLAGRILFGGYFAYNGINHFRNRQMLAGYARSKGVPAADAAVAASGLMIVAGGLSMLTGARPKAGAGLITGFLLGVSPAIHAFWKEREPQRRMQEMVNFTKNLALVGASLMAAAHPEPWPLRVGLPARAGTALVPARS